MSTIQLSRRWFSSDDLEEIIALPVVDAMVPLSSDAEFVERLALRLVFCSWKAEDPLEWSPMRVETDVDLLRASRARRSRELFDVLGKRIGALSTAITISIGSPLPVGNRGSHITVASRAPPAVPR
jgi:hypothetical protein